MEHMEKMAEKLLAERRQREKDRYQILTQKYKVPAKMAEKARQWSERKIWDVLTLQVNWVEDQKWLEKKRQENSDPGSGE